MKEFYEGTNFRDKTIAEIILANRILEEYADQGYDLSLRQLFYQLVARALRENTPRSYKQLGDVMGNARLAGVVDWDHIVDRGRFTQWSPHWETPAAAIKTLAGWFQNDKWETQPIHIEVMIEKDALSGIVAPVCGKLDVRFTANKGYSSLSHMHEIGKRIESKEDKEIVLLYFGDHDPSGLDMDRDIVERLEMFSGRSIDLRRLALTWEQIEELQPPENPTKFKDSRSKDYIYQYGHSSWELDAIEPAHLTQLARDAILSLRDDDLWKAAVEKEQQMIDELKEIADEHTE